MTTVTISLPDSLKEFVDTQVATKGYGNVSEYFRSLLREAQQNEADARLEALLLEGLASGDPIPVAKEFWTDLRTSVTTNESDLARAPCGDLTRVGGIPGMTLRQYAGRHDRHASDSAKMAVRRLEAR